jgi:hypothetical protein
VRDIEHTIDMSQDAEQLAKWMRGIVTAPDLPSIGIGRSRQGLYTSPS